MLKHGEINPLNVFGLRQLDHCPPHFTKVIFDLSTSERNIADWIYENLEGRFWIGNLYQVDNTTGARTIQHCVAFEKHSESTYFSLFLDTFNRWNLDFLN